MLQMYVVIYVHGLIQSFVGPLPYNQHVCDSRIEETFEEYKEHFETHNIEVKCEWHNGKPLTFANFKL